MAGSGDDSANDPHAEPDFELLQFQKQRSGPRVSLSEVQENGEVVHAEIEDFAQVGGDVNLIGMATAGTEENVIRALHKAGSLDNAEVLLGDGTGAQEESKQ